MNTETNSASISAVNFWLWVFPITYLIHIAEEYWGGEGYPAYILRLRGVHMSTARFLVAQSVGVVLVTVGVILARRFRYRWASLHCFALEMPSTKSDTG